jgi:hypothetical protein
MKPIVNFTKQSNPDPGPYRPYRPYRPGLADPRPDLAGAEGNSSRAGREPKKIRRATGGSRRKVVARPAGAEEKSSREPRCIHAPTSGGGWRPSRFPSGAATLVIQVVAGQALVEAPPQAQLSRSAAVRV